MKKHLECNLQMTIFKVNLLSFVLVHYKLMFVRQLEEIKTIFIDMGSHSLTRMQQYSKFIKTKKKYAKRTQLFLIVKGA